MKYVEFVLGENAKQPTKKYMGDAGWDLYTSAEVVIPPHATIDVPTNIYIKLPPFTFGRLTGRSSTMRTHSLLVNEGIIDNGYTGELFVGVHNLSGKAFTVQKGMRLAQILFHKIEDIRWAEVGIIVQKQGDRNNKGFGSTGIFEEV